MKLFDTLDISIKELGVGLAIFLLVFSISFFSRTHRIFKTDALHSESEVSLFIYNNSDLNGIIEQLNSTSITYNEDELRWVSNLLGWRSFKKGHYSVSGPISYDDFLSKLAFGSQTPVDVTILPGINIGRFSRNLGIQLLADSSEISLVFEDSTFLQSKGLSKEHLFGRMLPETFKMYWTAQPKAVINKVLNEFDDRVTNTFSARLDSLDKTIDDVLTMASIVEWEANLEDEKPIIAGLYWNRLDRRMHLQADPTISFALGERRRLLLEDYKIDHPFNTYTNYGLPPGPVTNPSLKTIKATLYPQEHNYLYMVASPEGGHIFNRTYKQHLVDADKWRKWLRRQYRIKRANEQNGI